MQRSTKVCAVHSRRLSICNISHNVIFQIAEDSEQTSTKSRQRRALLGLLTRPLKHTSVRILRNDNCRRIDITIRIKCVRAVWNRPSEEQAEKLCELVKAGIKKHWEVDILDNAGKSLNHPVCSCFLMLILSSKNKCYTDF